MTQPNLFGGAAVRKLSPLVRSTLSMTAMSILLRLLGLYLNSRITGLIGAEGMGLLQLGMNVEALAVTLGSSGIHFSVTRLISEELGLGRREGIGGILRAGGSYALCFSGAAALLLFFFAPGAARFAGDIRLTLPLRCFAPGLPFLALGSVFSGYFTAVYRPWKTMVCQGAEQLAMVLLTLLLLPLVPRESPALCCAVIALSASAAGGISLLLSYIMYRHDGIRSPGRPSLAGGLGRLMKLSLPLALSSYARTALSTLQHLLVPKALQRGGSTASAALAVYGTVSGMVFPVLSFASVFFTALAEMLIPTLTKAQVQGDRSAMERTAGRILSACLLFSSAVAALLFFLGPALGRLIFDSAEAGRYIRALSPLVIVMYMDSVVDGMLKGLGLHLSSMFINILDAGATLLAVSLLLPRYGVPAYLAILYLSECGNFLLSFIRLRRLITIKLL